MHEKLDRGVSNFYPMAGQYILDILLWVLNEGKLKPERSQILDIWKQTIMI